MPSVHVSSIPSNPCPPKSVGASCKAFGLHVSGFSSSPFGIEWMRYSEESPLHPAIKSLPHVAFEVDDIDAALEGQEVIYPPGSPSEGVRAAMILVDGAPVELIWFRKNNSAEAERLSDVTPSPRPTPSYACGRLSADGP